MTGHCLTVQVDDTSCITPCTERLAQALVDNLTGRSGNPELALLAARLLGTLLQRFPQLLWSVALIRALLVELHREEGALYLTGPAKPRMTLARVLRIRRKKQAMPLPAWTWLARVCKQAHLACTSCLTFPMKSSAVSCKDCCSLLPCITFLPFSFPLVRKQGHHMTATMMMAACDYPCTAHAHTEAQAGCWEW